MADRWPDFLVVGAPKAGTTALHGALARHPGLGLSGVKEPKYFLCGDRPPPRWRGPGDAHSSREWVWRRRDYLRLFADAPADVRTGESTPLYLADPEALRRIRATVPEVRLIAVLRDPVDRAYSNWMHLWSDGLEPEPDFVTALGREDERRHGGWAPFWGYRSLGLYGRQLEQVYALFPAEQVHVLRYRDLVDRQAEALRAVWRFLGVGDGPQPEVPRDNTKPYVPDTARARVLARTVRGGATVGAWAPPGLWRGLERRLHRQLHRGGTRRPTLDVDRRRAAQELFADDITLLEQVTGEDFTDWRVGVGNGDFASRQDGR